MRQLFFCCCFLLSMLFSEAQGEGPCNFRISLLTCAPGEELYSTFGHTAIRVEDAATGRDEVFNYGSFEFGPDFYTQFIRGKLLYFLAVENTPEFIYQYNIENRRVVAQELSLTCQQKTRLVDALYQNATGDERFYRYDFLFDNCTTRAGDILQKAGIKVVYNNILPTEPPTFRNLIHTYLDKGKQPWSKLGIDILLGAKLDRQVNNREAMFLPDYLFKGLDTATINGKPAVEKEFAMLDLPPALRNNSPFTPFVVFSALALVLLALSFSKKQSVASALKVFDIVFFFILGAAGILLLFMWFGTDHVVCSNNYNLLWALPTHIVMAFLLHRKKRWVQVYWKLTALIGLLLLITWSFLPQELNNALLPIVFLSTFRAWRSSRLDLYETNPT